jgi:hypothetical protein
VYGPVMLTKDVMYLIAVHVDDLPTAFNLSLTCKSFQEVIKKKHILLSLVESRCWFFDFQVYGKGCPSLAEVEAEMKTGRVLVPTYRKDPTEFVFFKAFLWGHDKVGKSQLIARLFWNHLLDDLPFPADNHRKNTTFHKVNGLLELVDSERDDVSHWSNLTNPQMKKDFQKLDSSHIVLYSVEDRESFEIADQILTLCQEIAHPIRASIALVANKIDLPEEKQQVSRREGLELARKHRVFFAESSSIRDDNSDMVHWIDLLVKNWVRKTRGVSKSGCVVS